MKKIRRISCFLPSCALRVRRELRGEYYPYNTIGYELVGNSEPVAPQHSVGSRIPRSFDSLRSLRTEELGISKSFHGLVTRNAHPARKRRERFGLL